VAGAGAAVEHVRATVALGAGLVSRNLHRLVLYEPAPGIEGTPNDDLKRIEDLVARGDSAARGTWRS
jgi:hypothetical protein